MGAYYFALLTGVCPPFGILDAEKISLFQKLLPAMKLEDCPLPARD